MRRLVGLVTLMAGCVSSGDYRSGPPITVGEPNYSGPTVSPTRPINGTPVPESPCLSPNPPPPDYMAVDSSGSRLMRWFQSGRGWTWGAASRGPIRDEGLDRLMVDTLTSSRPVPSQEPIAPINCIPIPSDPWVFPNTPNSQPVPPYYD
jgi:hypothetical protein